ncbi:MAG TPA: SDR family NAD(P)-dependent oxidoreductase [Thermoanaerobaculaceae bacterium]|nr:SDR family NAD(P)-dependent oxidoreductase [Thermoanaerobaculaceae bacterium]HRS16123.1 SDR family NAD(P)-dependent oxidoreductase [Thermoanaerobaculaceae bacterium]
MSNGRWAVVTGASSGIGEATARALAGAGFEVMVGARRVERLEALAAEIGGQAMQLDVTDAASVEAFCAAVPAELAVLVNNAGGALGLEPVGEARDADWLTMYETNVLGLMRVTRALLPRLVAGRGHIVNVTSIAGREVYPGGAGYTAAKHAARAVTQTLRMELCGTPVRITDIAPGLVETEFSRVRFFGDAERARKTYEGLTPLRAEDIADCIAWAVTRPAHVNVDEIVVKPVAQATALMVARGRGL